MKRKTGPGACLTCGADSDNRSTWGECSDCHTASVAAFEMRKVALIESARAMLASLGMKEGDAVTLYCRSWHPSVPGTTLNGVLKVNGSEGVYVLCSRKHYDVNGWKFGDKTIRTVG